jgi:hypothetical protein
MTLFRPQVPRRTLAHDGAEPLGLLPAYFNKSTLIAPPGFSRWRVPPAALAIHLCIGQVYAFSVFNLPLSRLIGRTESAPGD